MNTNTATETVIVYTKSNCPACTATKRQLGTFGLTVEERSLEDASNLEWAKAEGFAQAPVVVTDNDSWCGFRPDKLIELRTRS